MTNEPRRIRRWRFSFPHLSRFALEHLLLLPLGAAVALAWANTAAESYYRLTYAIAFAVNDVAMVFFFALMTKEVVEATAPGACCIRRARVAAGDRLSRRDGGAGADLSHTVDALLEEPMLSVAWPVAFATDIAVSYFIARVIFRPASGDSRCCCSSRSRPTGSASSRSRCSTRCRTCICSPAG